METLPVGAFQGQRLERPGTYIVVFAADWCPFCRSFLPTFARLEGRGPFRIARADVTDIDSPLWDRFEIRVVPTMLLFRNGTLATRFDGVAGVGLGERDAERARAAASA
jgi:thioredoxin 1